jgi:hypothetical protein
MTMARVTAPPEACAGTGTDYDSCEA